MLPQIGQKAVMLCEQPGGIFQPRQVTISSEGLLNGKNRRFHDNHENCVFPVAKPYALDSFEDLKLAPESLNPAIPTAWMVIGEDNGFFPYSTYLVETWEDIEARQQRRPEYQDVGRQNAELRNINSALGNPLLTTFAMIGAGVVTVMVTIIAAALVLAQFGGQDSPEGTAGLLGAMGLALGAVRIPKRRERRWSVYLFDTLTGGKKHYSLPWSEIAANISPDCWRFPRLEQWRWYCLVGLPLVLGLLGAMVYQLAPQLLVLEIMVGLVVLPVVAMLGWLKGPVVAPLFGWKYRPYCKVYRGVDSNGEIIIAPIRYTGLTGVDPEIWKALVDQHLEQVRAEAQKAGLEEMPQYDPIVNRADDAWEDVHGLLEREDTRIPMTMQQKLQIGSVVTMAGGSILMAFFIVMATAGG